MATDAKYPLTDVSNIIHTEVISRTHDLSGTKVIARHVHDLYGRPGTYSGLRFRARIVRDVRYEQCVATVSCWSNNAWSLIESIDITMLPIVKFNRLSIERGDWAEAMEESLDILLRLGLDIVP